MFSHPWLFRTAILVAVCILVVIGSGAVITSIHQAGSAESAPPALNVVGVQVHQAMGFAGLALTLGLGLWSWLTKRSLLRALAVAVVVLAAADIWVATPPPLSSSAAALHAWLAACFFSSLVAICAIASQDGSRHTEFVDDRGLRFLRPLTMATPLLVFLQIGLGALYRHKVTSVFWHMGGALLVALAGLISSMVVIQQYPDHRALKNSATALMTVVLAQVALGVAAFTMQLLETDNTLALTLSTVSHVVVGNLTLATSLIFALEVYRDVGPNAVRA